MELQEWRGVGASAIGTSHLKTGAPCQDGFRLHFFNNKVNQEEEVALLVAADGAGSGAHSDVGAQLACQELFDSVAIFLGDGHRLESLTRETAFEWLSHVAEVISRRAEADAQEVREYACTLLAALISPTHAAYLQVGDGAMVVRTAGAEWCYVFWPQHGEYINSTVFVTDPAARANFEFDMRADAIHEIAALTDGIEALVLQYATHTVHAPFFDKMFPPVRGLSHPGFDAALSEQLATYLASDAVCSRTDDDKTLLLASRLKGR